MRFRYSDVMLDFLSEHYKTKRPAELADAFNTHFGLDKSASEIRAAVKNHGIKSGRVPGLEKGERYYKWTHGQLDWMRANYPAYSRKDLLEKFNAHFGTEKTINQLVQCLKNHKITSGRKGFFTKGHESWNKDTKGLTGANSGSFKKGDVPANQKPIGHERICSKDGYVLIKVDETNPHTGFRGWYRHKHVVVWKAANGPVPDDKCVSFKDGDRTNCDINNLELVTRGELAYMNCHFGGHEPELHPTVRSMARLATKAAALKRVVAAA